MFQGSIHLLRLAIIFRWHISGLVFRITISLTPVFRCNKQKERYNGNARQWTIIAD